MSRLPSLNSLRAFEAAARHGSLSRAAQELHVTHSALSHQIKALETELGMALFRRTGRGLVPTEAGRLLLPALGEAFGRIRAAVEAVRRGPRAGVLTLSVEPSFAARWLVLRLGRFRAAHGQVELRLLPSEDVVDLAREDVDLAIRYGRGDWPDLQADLLFHARVFPVASPDLLAAGPPLREPADLRRHTLLHEDSDLYWREWLVAAGAGAVDASRGPRFATAHLALAAAAAGQGIALADDALAAADLADGRLVRLFRVEIATEHGYWLLIPRHAAGRPELSAFRSWILDEVRRTGAGSAAA
jgi:LysR family glycine cleavage system transcriptional activator